MSDISPAGQKSAAAVAQPAFWGMLAPADRERVWAAGTKHHHPANTTILREGDPSGSVFVLLSGRVKIVTASSRGYRCILAIRSAGDLFGEMSAIDGEPRMASVVAIDPVGLLRIPLADFGCLLHTRPLVAKAVMKVVAGRLRSDNHRQTEFADITMAQRLDIFLAELALHHGVACADGVAITLPFSQEEIASSINASREAVVRALKVLRDQGIVTTSRQRIVVLRLEVLRRRARHVHVGDTVPLPG